MVMPVAMEGDQVDHGNSLDLRALFKQFAHHESIVVGKKRYTYSEWERILAAYLFTLESLNISITETPQRVGLLAATSFEALNVMVALLLLRATPVWLPTTLSSVRLDSLIKDGKLPLAIVDDKLLKAPLYSKNLMKLSKIVKKVSYLLGESKSESAPFVVSAFKKSWKLPAEQEASIVFSSGSLGGTKGVVLTIENIIFSALGSIDFYKMQAGDRFFASLPMHHVGGLMVPFRALLCGGCTIFYQRIDKVLAEERVDFLSLVPTQLIRLLDKERLLPRLKQIRAIIVGGGPLARFPWSYAKEKGIAISPSYGLSEMCAQVTALPPFSDSYSERSCGKALPYREFKITVDQEILVRGRSLCHSYFIAGEEVPLPRDEEGWFHTGDLGEVSGDAGDEGSLHLLGRKDLNFVSGGENVNPLLIEAVLKEIPWVIDAVVVPAPHYEFGEVPIAFVEAARKLPLKKMLLYLKERLPLYMVPKNVIFLEEQNPFKNLKYNRKALTEYAKTINQ
ncbi:MAG: AMP-binding protein [Oligoflexia bacterium]|nr:AMP-binding protein [Oligoflexia bacterium]MBF0365673.1 AMP-binding protein [Oligoflexia bacterium]